MDRKIIISKSKYVCGLQCSRYLWFLVNARDQIPEPDFATKFMFTQGHIVGEYAKKLFPDGTDLGKMDNLQLQLEKTIELLPEKKPIFEAAFSTEKAYCRVDILKPSGEDNWDLIEVKSSTQIKEEYLHDITFQNYTLLESGVKIRKSFLMHINNQYVRKVKIEPGKLFALVDITDNVNEILPGIEARLEKFIEIAGGQNPPDAKIGRHCDNPYSCPLKKKCWEFLPEHHVFNLYGNKDKALDLYSRGILSMEDIPGDYSLTEKQRIQLESVKSKHAKVDKKEITSFLKKLEYPLYFFDFETFSTAIPLYDGVKPFQRIPFQYSIHVVESLDGKPVHYDFLAEGKADPRLELLKNLKEHLGEKGSIIVYYDYFEKGVLKELAEKFPEYCGWVEAVIPRIVDLYRPFGNFYYYSATQNGSASVKHVLPAITNLSYHNLEISNGLAASVYFLYACGHYDFDKNPDEKLVEDLKEKPGEESGKNLTGHPGEHPGEHIDEYPGEKQDEYLVEKSGKKQDEKLDKKSGKNSNYGCQRIEEAEKIRESLIKYCRMDTGGMIHILKGLEKEINEN